MNAKHGVLLLLLVGLAGCDDLKIDSGDSYRWGSSLTATLTYKGHAIPVTTATTGVTAKWYDDKGNVIGDGVSIVISNLSAGKHKIRADVTLNGKADSVDRTIDVIAKPPVITINSNGQSRFDVGSTFSISATADDPQTGPVDSSALDWALDKNKLGTGASQSLSGLLPGKHTLSITTVDAPGLTGTAKLDFTIFNLPPVASISSPAAGLSVHSYVSVMFDGSATDPDPLNGSAQVPDDRLQWSSNKQGSLGSGSSLRVKSLEPGNHTITLSAKDEFGAVGKATLDVTVIDNPSRVDVQAPSNNDSFEVGSSVRFQAQVTETEATQIDDSRVVWTSQLDGKIGTGRSMSTSKLRPGIHEVTCTATDSYGVSGSGHVSVVIRNDPPTVQILQPSDGASFHGGDQITLQGAATAPVQGNLDGGSLRWTSDDGKEFASGTNPRVRASRLGFGDHVITLTAKDKFGASASAQVHVTIMRQPYLVTIISPANGSSFNQGASVVLTGNAKDLDQNKGVSGQDLLWSDTFNGQTSPLGGGESVTLTTLGIGVHQIVLTAQDPGDPTVTNTATVFVRINAPAAPSGVAATGSTTVATTTPIGTPSGTAGITGALGTPGTP
jgi:hypothetical protein